MSPPSGYAPARETESEISKIPDITTADVLVEFHSPDGSGCHFAHSVFWNSTGIIASIVNNENKKGSESGKLLHATHFNEMIYYGDGH